MKTKAYLKRHIHLIKHLIKGDLNHCSYTQVDNIYSNGKVKSITKLISCTCGKNFYIH